MDIIQLLPVFGAVSSVIALYMSATKLKSKTEAEKKLIDTIEKNYRSKLSSSDLNEIVHIRNNLVHGKEVNRESVERAYKMITLFLQDLDKEDIELLKEGLNQNSYKGKLRYTDKIISKSNVS
ncbi:hypothetical protein BCU24_01230 [Vibrio cyclitrophicus]|uniref:hypothetical protein n=1 Tax=Vibrio cyclitrophicus TaxID=47951 RepID=UPI000C81DECA|nr:hypothetical protein [Vibrio cyclitrophicus]PMJ40784.1 hypothetical protein BCU24_01230 [Vibrio cyclitrophicus]